MTMWDHTTVSGDDDDFLGEVLLDIVDADLVNMQVDYQLSEHDENIGNLPRPPPLRHTSQEAVMEDEAHMPRISVTSIYKTRSSEHASTMSFGLSHHGGRSQCIRGVCETTLLRESPTLKSRRNVVVEQTRWFGNSEHQRLDHITKTVWCSMYSLVLQIDILLQ